MRSQKYAKMNKRDFELGRKYYLSLSFTLTCTFTRVRFAHLNKLTLSLPLSLKGQWRLLPTPEIRSSNPVIGKSYLQSNNLKLYWKDENSTVHPRLVTLYLNQMGLQCYFPLAKCGSIFISQFYKQPTIVLQLLSCNTSNFLISLTVHL